MQNMHNYVLVLAPIQAMIISGLYHTKQNEFAIINDTYECIHCIFELLLLMEYEYGYPIQIMNATCSVYAVIHSCL